MPEARDAWSWPEQQRRAGVILEEPMRPRDMLDEFGYDARHLCGECRHFQLAGNGIGNRCLLSLRGSPARLGYTWRADWKSCGRWLRAEVADDPARARPGDQLRLM
jgi:hypothetical protein